MLQNPDAKHRYLHIGKSIHSHSQFARPAASRPTRLHSVPFNAKRQRCVLREPLLGMSALPRQRLRCLVLKSAGRVEMVGSALSCI